MRCYKNFLVEKINLRKGFLPHLGLCHVTIFLELRKWVLIRSKNFQNHPQTGDYRVK